MPPPRHQNPSLKRADDGGKVLDCVPYTILYELSVLRHTPTIAKTMPEI